MDIQLIRNATLKLNYGDHTFLIDPYFAPAFSQFSFSGKSKNPTADLPVSVAEILSGVDAVFVSHLHPGHFDEEAQRVLSKDMPIYCQPSDADAIRKMGFRDVIPVNDQVTIGAVQVTRTNCQHGSGDILPFMGTASGFVFKHVGEETLYWCGDTIWYEEVMNVIDNHQPEVIVCHAGGNRFFASHPIFAPGFSADSEPLVMNACQVTTLCDYAPNSQVIATHIGAIDHETETRESLKKAATKELGEGRLLIPNDGDHLIFELTNK